MKRAREPTARIVELIVSSVEKHLLNATRPLGNAAADSFSADRSYCTVRTGRFVDQNGTPRRYKNHRTSGGTDSAIFIFSRRRNSLITEARAGPVVRACREAYPFRDEKTKKNRLSPGDGWLRLDGRRAGGRNRSAFRARAAGHRGSFEIYGPAIG